MLWKLRGRPASVRLLLKGLLTPWILLPPNEDDDLMHASVLTHELADFVVWLHGGGDLSLQIALLLS